MSKGEEQLLEEELKTILDNFEKCKNYVDVLRYNIVIERERQNKKLSDLSNKLNKSVDVQTQIAKNSQAILKRMQVTSVNIGQAMR